MGVRLRTEVADRHSQTHDDRQCQDGDAMESLARRVTANPPDRAADELGRPLEKRRWLVFGKHGGSAWWGVWGAAKILTRLLTCSINASQFPAQ